MSVEDKDKSFWQKAADAAASVYNFLDGKKRRIALVGGFLVSVCKPGTVAYTVGKYLLVVFSSADAVDNGAKLLKDKLQVK